MFSFEGRPRAAPQGLAADVLFDGDLAADAGRPDRGAGAGPARRHAWRPRDRPARGRHVRRARLRGWRRQAARRAAVHRRRAAARERGRPARRPLAAADRRGRRARRASVPDAPGSAADTAALLELARVFQGRPSRKTLVLASIDGSHARRGGRAPARRGASGARPGGRGDRRVRPRRARPAGPYVQAWSNDARRAGIALQRTVADSIRQELGSAGGGSGTFGQLARLSFPIGIGAQGVLLEPGYDAVRISGSGELPPGGHGPAGAIDEDRLGALGRATLRTLTARRPGPASGARPEELHAGREPGAARAGRCRCSPARCSCRCSWQPWTPSPARAGAGCDVLAVVALARRLGRAVPRRPR